MKKPFIAVLAAVLVLGATPVFAANADNPYKNVDRSNDKGNSTGDAQVPDLNQRELDRVRSESRTVYVPQPQPAPAVPVR